MRVVVILGIFYLSAPATAGVYNLGEQHPYVPFSDARGYVLKLRAVAIDKGVPAPESFRAQVLRQVSQLEEAKTSGVFSTIDRVNLSGCYLRLGQAPKALNLLLEEPADHFLILANLASAYFQVGQLERAYGTQERLLAAWPSTFAGWTEQQLLFYRLSEQHVLKLLESRLEESRRPRSNEPVSIDPIFPRFRLPAVEAYRAGEIPGPLRDRLPLEAPALVFQLCNWYPQDFRLYWLMGEMLNFLGQIGQASGILDELADSGRSALYRDLPAHRRILGEALPAYRELQSPTKRGVLLAQLLCLPRPNFGGAVGEATQVVVNQAAVIAMPEFEKPPQPPEVPPTPDARALPFNWGHVTVSFAFGFLVSALIGFQMQEWRRRKSPVPVAGPSKT